MAPGIDMNVTPRLRAIGITLALFACAPVLARNAPDDPAAVVERARTMIFGGEPAAALELLRPLAERHPGSTDVHFFRGMAAVAAAGPADDRPGAPGVDGARRALLDEAAESYRHILESHPGLATVRQRLAEVLFWRGEPAAALELLRPLAERQPGNTNVWFFRGVAAAAAAGPAGGRPGGAPGADEARRALLDEAAESYRHILESRPGLVAVRQKLAEVMIRKGEPAAALGLLRPLAERRSENTDVHFFRGMAAAAAANLPEDRPGAPGSDEARRALLDEAVESYRHILESRPGLVVVRQKLAEVLFQRGRCMAPPESLLKHLLGDDCDAAAHHFRRALAGRLPDAVAERVSQLIAVVQARKRVSGQFGLAIAPDSNLNAGTSARTFATRLRNPFTGESLEFEIGKDARGVSGIGAIISASGEYLHPAGFRPFENSMTRLRLGGAFYRREYGGRRFDDMTISVYAGPQLLLPRGRASLLVKADRRWDSLEVETDRERDGVEVETVRWSEKPVSRSLGLRLEGGLRLGDRLWLGGGLERAALRHRYALVNDGPRTDLGLDLSFSATPAITFGARGGWQRGKAERPDLRSRTRRIGGFAAADLPPVLGVTGFHTALYHDVLFTRYDEPGYFLITPEARRDRTSISRLSVSNDHFELFRFVPALSLVHERRETNVDRLFDYQRNRVEITMRRRF